MHIQQIEVEGIQSFRDRQVVDISGFPLLAAVGKNGHGKSTIIVDAIMFAFWGKVRTRTMDEMISVGAPRAFVAIDFTLEDGNLYRVQRSAPRTGAGEGAVFVADDTEASGWKPLVEDGVKEVTARVVELLGMTYEVARQTWIAQQGNYGMFAKSVPAKRFELLSAVFDLDKYQPLAAKANEQLKKAESDLDTIDGSAREVQDQLETAGAPDGGPADGVVETSITEANAQIDAAQQAIAELNVGDPARRAEEAESALRNISARRTGVLDGARTSLAAAQADQASADRRAEAARAAADQVAARRAVETNQRAAQAQQGAEARRGRASEAIARIDADHWALGEKRDRIAQIAAQADEKHAAADAAAAIAADRLELRNTLLGQHAEATKQIAASNKRIETLRLSLHDAATAECFSCKQHLSPADAQALIDSQEREIADAQAQTERITAEGKAATTAAEEADSARKAALNDERALRRQVDALQRDVVRIETEAAQRPAHEAEVTSATEAIAASVAEAAGALQAIEGERVAAIEAANAEHDAATTALAARIGEAEALIAAHGQPTEEEITARAAAEQLRAAAQAEVNDVATKRSALQAAIDSGRAQLSRAEALRATRQQRAERVAALESRKVELLGRRGDVERDRRHWSVLAKAYSNSGIPAMLLTSITEELNEAINVSLDHISDGQLAVVMRASRETQKGSVDSKITIYVDTPEGMRSYESLSGGQQFRVDLAIRTGLSKVITRRTGTPLRTFILDEGWGTLDEDGIRAAVDTLQRLSGEFNVLTVSHIDSVRNAFPARIQVDKSTGTSIAEVMAA